MKNVSRKCRKGHIYVTSADGPGTCWCGEAAALEIAPVEISLDEKRQRGTLKRRRSKQHESDD